MGPEMKFNQIEAYRAVMLAGSVTEAANFLNVSQPGISRLIKDLERSIGFDLFDRLPGKITPTAEGLVFFRHVQETYDGIRHLEGVAEEISNLKHDRLRIAAFPAASIGVAPRAIERMNASFPDLKFRLEVRSSGKILDLISNNQIDVGVAAFPIDHPGVLLERIYEPACPCILPVSHPMADLQVIEAHELAAETLLGISDHLTLGKQMAKAREMAREIAADRRENLVESTSSFAIGQLVKMGMGVAVIDPLTASTFDDTELRVLPFKPKIAFGFSIVVPEHSVRSRAAAMFALILHETIKSTLSSL